MSPLPPKLIDDIAAEEDDGIAAAEDDGIAAAEDDATATAEDDVGRGFLVYFKYADLPVSLNSKYIDSKIP